MHKSGRKHGQKEPVPPTAREAGRAAVLQGGEERARCQACLPAPDSKRSEGRCPTTCARGSGQGRPSEPLPRRTGGPPGHTAECHTVTLRADACHMVVLTDSIKCKLNCGDRQAGTLRGKEPLPVLVVGGFKVHKCQNSSHAPHSFCVDGPLPRKNGGWGTTPTLLCPIPRGLL